MCVTQQPEGANSVPSYFTILQDSPVVPDRRNSLLLLPLDGSGKNDVLDLPPQPSGQAHHLPHRHLHTYVIKYTLVHHLHTNRTLPEPNLWQRLKSGLEAFGRNLGVVGVEIIFEDFLVLGFSTSEMLDLPGENQIFQGET